jgi:hypothetical protein
MSASPREFTTTDEETINSLPIAQLEVALALNYDVFKAKEASAVGDAVCSTYLATVKPIGAKLLSLKQNALGASKTAALLVADDTNDEPATNDASFRITLSGVFIGSDDTGCMGHKSARDGLPRRPAGSVQRHEREITLFPQEFRPQNGHRA